LPHFTLQITSPGGPILNGFIGVSLARRNALIALGQPIPNAVQIRGLVDTGASGTCVDPAVLTSLGLSPTGSVMVNTPSTGSQPHTADQYDISLIIPGALPTHAPLTVQNLPVMCAQLLPSQGFHALIGRDILSLCWFGYNGTTGLFTLAY
jgi:hypothetical protein